MDKRVRRIIRLGYNLRFHHILKDLREKLRDFHNKILSNEIKKFIAFYFFINFNKLLARALILLEIGH